MKSLKKEIEKNIYGEFDVQAEVDGCGVDDLELVEKKVIDGLILYLAKDNVNDLLYIVREDGSGFSSACLYNSLDDQKTIAAWNVDFDIKILTEWIGEDEVYLCLDIAKENYWGL